MSSTLASTHRLLTYKFRDDGIQCIVSLLFLISELTDVLLGVLYQALCTLHALHRDRFTCLARLLFYQLKPCLQDLGCSMTIMKGLPHEYGLLHGACLSPRLAAPVRETHQTQNSLTTLMQCWLHDSKHAARIASVKVLQVVTVDGRLLQEPPQSCD